MLAAPTMLPPTERDFEIHRQSLVEYQSTRTIADKHHISQTRVRQVIARVSQWLAATIPVKTELDRDAETRLAQHLAAEQLRHQCVQLRAHWDGTSDPKYLRQQTRVILAMARLGIVPGTIDALMADAESSRQTPSAVETSTHAPSAVETSTYAPRAVNPAADSNADGTRSVPPTDPPNVACSADLPPTVTERRPAAASFAASDSPDEASDTPSDTDEQALQGLTLMENRLLTLIDQAGDQDPDRRASLEESLANIRHSKAALEIRISPHKPGATISVWPPDAVNDAAPELNAQLQTQHP